MKKTYLVEESNSEEKIYESILLKSKNLKILSNELALRILKELYKKPMCSMDLARKLKVHEQKIYYYIRKMEKIGIIKLIGEEKRVGTLAKIFSLKHPVVSLKLIDEPKSVLKKKKYSQVEFLEPFIKNGVLNSIIVVGSPDPHGRYDARASDGYAAIDFAMFLGNVSRAVPSFVYKLDTQITKDDLKKNLILIGGPKVNILIDKLNDRMPIRFDKERDWSVYSSISRNHYYDEDIGIVIKTDNPFNKNSKVLIMAGKKFKGTRAATIAVMKHYDKVLEGNSNNRKIKARIVMPLDKDSDGIVDDVKFVE